ncbi:MAG: hypothetical protein QOF63_4270 [Thermoanaerobaculia bacterium]|jgi:hypothetical protein|nr:hypothetical protein [Thermoanaerobaculia bacterium]
MKQSFYELFSKMTPEAQERVKARAAKLLRSMAIQDVRRTQAGIKRARGKPKGTAKP